MGVNIFPGDLLFKNFGVNDQRKVVFYDYDEICYLSECNFRRIPPPRSSLDLFRDEPWYSVNPNDIFPEEFITFISTDPKIRKMLMELHPDLFDISSWQNAQEGLAAGRQADVLSLSPEVEVFPQTPECRSIGSTVSGRCGLKRTQGSGLSIKPTSWNVVLLTLFGLLHQLVQHQQQLITMRFKNLDFTKEILHLNTAFMINKLLGRIMNRIMNGDDLL